ncbi:hypothetical protein SASPL_148463 [Salvia splendens]|uniref:Fructose-bisphosphate aldolase n=1 Tax=Salvia splendens TaxID=180675 RepID=A0A8X8Z4A8_SALSN|nr:hypothetical protein SASPL_148463 [Salvia splendens]
MAKAGGVVGFVGLDDISLELAASLLRSGYSVQAFEKSSQLIDDFSNLGGKRCANLTEIKQGVSALVTLISHSDQIDDLFHGDEGILKEDHHVANVVDMYAFKSVSEVSHGKVMVISSGLSESTSRAKPFLSAMGKKLFAFEGDVGAGSKSKMIIELLEGIHLVASLEAISLSTQAGIHPQTVYDIVSNAAGNSWIFKNYIPNLLQSNPSTSHLFSTFNKSMEIILEMARSLIFPLPLTSVAHQQILAGCSHGGKEDENATLLKVWEELSGVNIRGAANAKPYNPEELAKQLSAKSKTAKRIGFIGLGAMGFGMATHLLKSNFTVLGYDVSLALTLLCIPSKIHECMAVLPWIAIIKIVLNLAASEVREPSIASNNLRSSSAMVAKVVALLSGDVLPAVVISLEGRIPASWRTPRQCLQFCQTTIDFFKLASLGDVVTVVGHRAGLPLIVSVVADQVQINLGGCARGFPSGSGVRSEGTVRLFRAQIILDRITLSIQRFYTTISDLMVWVFALPSGATIILSSTVKDGLYIIHISYHQHMIRLYNSENWWMLPRRSGDEKLYIINGGSQLIWKPKMNMTHLLERHGPTSCYSEPTGVIHSKHDHNSKILTITLELCLDTTSLFEHYIVTLTGVKPEPEKFKNIGFQFSIIMGGENMTSMINSLLLVNIFNILVLISWEVIAVDLLIISCYDASLVEQFDLQQLEADAAVSVIGAVDAWIICPFFIQGGRYTIMDVHYVADGDSLIPAGETEFAKDASFGYRSSDLREWVEEKTGGRINAGSVASISIALLRVGGPRAVCEHLCSLKKGSSCIVNAASERDMAVFAAGMIEAEIKGKSFLCRTAASFVSTRVGIKPKAPVLPHDLMLSRERIGGLIVVGSYVPKTTRQVEELLVQRGHALKMIEVLVNKVAESSIEEREQEINKVADMADVYLKSGKDTLILTSRQLLVGKNASESLVINSKVSSALVEIVRRITTRPRYILAKGGITSSDLATKALEVKRAKIVGQALAGIPLWQLGPESRHPCIPYIVFPGNVGDNNAIAEVVKNWTHPGRLSTKELLLNAEKGGYAIGAFNVYNLEGVLAVVAAAEEQRSPAILQIHPGAFKQGGAPLVASCVFAAEQASVPITVHFDHGNSKQELLEILELGFDSIMADGSHLSFKENIAYTKYLADLAHSKNLMIEAELGRLSGTEDDLTVEDYLARLTDVNQANEFIDSTGIDFLAVCIGNVHGTYPVGGPNLRLDLLKDIYALTSKRGVHLVLHGASGLHKDIIEECVRLGVRKFNVNTEVRKAYMGSLTKTEKDVVNVMTSAKEAMKVVVAEKMHLFGSAGKA